MGKPFNWRDYVAISEDFTPEQQGLIEQSFDRIAQFHDQEGQLLIRAAAKRAGGRVSIEPGESNTGELGRMELNFETLNDLRYTNDAQGRGPSLLGTMVHEMYHMTDENAEKELKMADRIMSTVVRSDGSKQYVPELGVVMDSWSDTFFRLRRGTPQERNEIAEYLEENYPNNPRLQEYAHMVRTTTNEEWKQRFAEAGVTDADGTLLSETRATEYTDAVMAKNVGNAEPQRGTYAATKDGEPYSVENVPQVLPMAQPTKGFDGPGNVDVAPVVAKSLQGIDLSALRVCSTDQKDYCISENGTFSPSNVKHDMQPGPEQQNQR